MALWLVCLTLDQLVWIQSLAAGIVLCSWEGHLNGYQQMLWITLRWTGIQGGVGIEILIVASCYRNCDELWPHGALGLYADYFALLHLEYWFHFNK